MKFETLRYCFFECVFSTCTWKPFEPLGLWVTPNIPHLNAHEAKRYVSCPHMLDFHHPICYLKKSIFPCLVFDKKKPTLIMTSLWSCGRVVMLDIFSCVTCYILPVLGGAFDTWAIRGDLPDSIHHLISLLSRHNYRNHQFCTKTQYNKAWHNRDKGILHIEYHLCLNKKSG